MGRYNQPPPNEVWEKVIAYYNASPYISVTATSREFKIPFQQVKNKLVELGIYRRPEPHKVNIMASKRREEKPGRFAKMDFFKSTK
jgi:hypothetical protein